MPRNWSPEDTESLRYRRGLEAREALGLKDVVEAAESDPGRFLTAWCLASRLADEQVRREVGEAAWSAYCNELDRSRLRERRGKGKSFGRSGRRRQHKLDDVLAEIGLRTGPSSSPH